MTEEKKIRNLFCRVGSKSDIAGDIIAMMPAHTAYVEPFVGSGAVYWRKPKEKTEILNDLDTYLIDGYKIAKKARNLDIGAYKRALSTQAKLTKFMATKWFEPNDILVQHVLRACAGFNSKYKGKVYLENVGTINKLQNLPEYQWRLRGTKLLNKDYRDVIAKYDAPGVLFYIDTPYENTDTDIYANLAIDLDEFANILRHMRGYWILSINDSAANRRRFAGYQ